MSPPSNEAASNSRTSPSHTVYLVAAAVTLAVAILLMLGEATGRVFIPKGLFTLLAVVSVGTFVGYLMLLLRAEVAQLRAELAAVIREPHRPSHGRVYAAAPAPVGQGDTVRLGPVGLDTESIQAARSIARDLLGRKHS